MRILFCDDDKFIRDQLQKYVRDFFASFGGHRPEFAAYESGDILIQNESKADIACPESFENTT